MRQRGQETGGGGGGKGAEIRERIVRRAALEFKDGMFGKAKISSGKITWSGQF